MSDEDNTQDELEHLLPRFKDIFASANINFLMGSGISQPCLPTLNNIEHDINNAKKAVEKSDKYKEYFEKVMLPNKYIISYDFKEPCSKYRHDKLQEEAEPNKISLWITYRNYMNFLTTLSKLILDRKTTVIGRQVNIFTTNIDIFFEKVLEDLEIHYNDGFLGKMNPVFDLSNFKQSIIQRSQHFDKRSEIPIFNIFKIHGSVNWKYNESDLNNENRKIYLSSDLSHFERSLIKKKRTFLKEYQKKILVVNPEETKFSETVLNKYYYELLRSYSNELEKENSVLFVIGFSMKDQHIKEITKRAARSNPTLQVYVFSYSEDSGAYLNELMETSKNHNIKIIAPKNGDNYGLERITDQIFKKMNATKEDSSDA